MTTVLDRPSPEAVAPDARTVVDELVLVAVPSAIQCAQLLLASVARRWNLTPSVITKASDVLDELVAHAVATTGISGNESVSRIKADRLVLLGVRLRHNGPRLVIEVWDTGSESLHGLLATSPALADVDHWAVELPKSGQRVVWCVLGGEVAEPTLVIPVPRARTGAVPPPSRPIHIMRDPALLQRVLDGLRSLDPSKQEK